MRQALLQDEPRVGQHSGRGHGEGAQTPPGSSLEAVEDDSESLVLQPLLQPPAPSPSPSFLSWSEAPDLDKCYTVERDLASQVVPEGTSGGAWGGLPRGGPAAEEEGGRRGQQRNPPRSVVCSMCSFSCRLCGAGLGWGVVLVPWASSWDGFLAMCLRW